MKVFCFGINDKKNSGKELNKIDVRFAKGSRKSIV